MDSTAAHQASGHMEVQILSVHVKTFRETETALSEDQTSNLGYRISIGASLDQEDGTIGIGVRATLYDSDPEHDDGGQALIETEVVCTFAVPDLAKFCGEDELVRIPKPFFANLVGISVSTTRGILVGRARMSLVSEMPLPVIASSTIIEQFLEDQGVQWIADA